MKILVADGNRDAADSMQRVLESDHHSALFDMDMPAADGYLVARALR
jgi:CheY-like chemotaxis protein